MTASTKAKNAKTDHEGVAKVYKKRPRPERVPRWQRLLLALVVLSGAIVTNVALAPGAAAATYAYSATWRSSPQGSTFSIVPSGYAQTLGVSAAEGVWNNALSMAGTRPYSSAVYDSMKEQLKCHLAYKLKTPYNLDTWRPKVSWWRQLYPELCNP